MTTKRDEFGNIIDLFFCFNEEACGAKETSTAHTFKRVSRYEQLYIWFISESSNLHGTTGHIYSS
jgi:hypothetical protein